MPAERTNFCTPCSRSFVRPSDLRRHVLKHSGPAGRMAEGRDFKSIQQHNSEQNHGAAHLKSKRRHECSFPGCDEHFSDPIKRLFHEKLLHNIDRKLYNIVMKVTGGTPVGSSESPFMTSTMGAYATSARQVGPSLPTTSRASVISNGVLQLRPPVSVSTTSPSPLSSSSSSKVRPAKRGQTRFVRYPPPPPPPLPLATKVTGFSAPVPMDWAVGSSHMQAQPSNINPQPEITIAPISAAINSPRTLPPAAWLIADADNFNAKHPVRSSALDLWLKYPHF